METVDDLHFGSFLLTNPPTLDPMPALAPIFVWVLTNRPLVEQFVGWSADQLKHNP